MGFWSTLNSIRTNRANFKQWEKDEADNDAKRKELYQRNPLSEEKLAQKQKLADTIIDTITIMDEQSESVSEDVETITQPIVGTSMVGGIALSSIVAFKYLKTKSNENDNEIDKVGKKLTTEQYKQIIELNKENKSFKYPIIADWQIQRALKDNKKYKKLIVPKDLKATVEDMHKNYLKLNKKMFRQAGYAGVGIVLSGLAAFLAATIGATKFQVGSSRVARYNARESLNDPKNFVIYTDEQIEQAKENLKNNPPKKKKGIFSRFKKDDDTAGFFSNMKNLAVNKRKYNAWKKENDKRDPRIMRELTPEELEEAKRDKEVIQRITKKINNRAEEYSENMETAATTILGSSILLGGIMSAAVNWILNKSGTNNKIASWVVGKLTNKETQVAYNELLKLDPKTNEFKTARKEFFEKCSKHLYDKKASKSKLAEIKANLKELYAKILTSRRGRNIGLFGFIGTGVTSFIGLIMALKLQKNAARAGRYNAKEELRNNPQEFISYSEEEMKQVENVKAEEKTMGQKFKEYMTFLPTAWKHYKEYDNYKKGELKDTKALKEELKKLEVSDEQLREGKNLQRKLFNTFEKIDDKSQEYSENMEAASDISMQLVSLGGQAALFAPLITVGTLIATKRYDLLTKMGVTAADFISRFSFIAKSKLFKNHLNQISENLEKAVEKQTIYRWDDLDKKQIEFLKNLKDKEIIKALIKQSDSTEKSLPFIINIANKATSFALLKLIRVLEKVDMNKLKSIVNKLEKVEAENINAVLAKLKDSDFDQLMDKKYLANLVREGKLPLNSADIDNISKVLTRINSIDNQFSISKNLLNKNLIIKPNEDTGEFIQALEKNAEKEFDFKTFINNTMKNLPDNSSDIEKQLKKAKDVGNKILAHSKNKKYYIRGARAFARLSKNAPAEELSLLVQKAIKVAIDEPEKFVKLMNDPEEAKKIFMTPALKTFITTAGISWGVICLALTFAVQSYFAKLQKEAGRLGVMKAMEELQDDRIYADETPKQIAFQSSNTKEKASISQQTNNLPPNIQKLLNSTKNKVAV